LFFKVFIFVVEGPFLQGVFEKSGVFVMVFCGHNVVVECLIVVVSGAFSGG